MFVRRSLQQFAGNCTRSVPVRLAWCLAASLCLALVGCDQQSGLVPATGKVLVDGEPAAGANVLFFPQSSESSNVASGATDANGQYSLISNLEPGVAPGKYKVTVTWPEPPKPGARLSVMEDAKDPPDLLRGKYADPNRTQLSVEITSSTTEIPPLELKTR